MLTESELRGFQLEIAPILDLDGWPPVGAKLENFYGALRGHGSVGINDMEVLTRMSKRWAKLDQRIRHFYSTLTKGWIEEAFLDDVQMRAIDAALNRIFYGRDNDEWVFEAIVELWYDFFGYYDNTDFQPTVGNARLGVA